MHPHKQPSPFSLAPLSGLRDVTRTDGDCHIDLVGKSERVTARALAGGVFEVAFNRNAETVERYVPPLANLPDPLKDRDKGAAVRRDEAKYTIAITSDNGATLTVGLNPFTIGLSLDVRSESSGTSVVPLIPFDQSQRIGFLGKKFAMGLRMPDETPYYGFGEKTGSLNKHGERMKFWNYDVCADLPDGFRTDHYDPTYCAIPVAIWSVTDESSGATAYAAVLIDNSGPTWFNCQTNDFGEPDLFYFGTYLGEPRFYFLTGATMAEVCAKLARMTGLPQSLPPLWALGNHQCRWGYDHEKVYKSIVESYKEFDIPVHALWLDIDYMDEYQPFTWHPERVRSPEGLSNWLCERQVRMVTIIDPGIPVREDNAAYVEGIEKDLFCRASSGEPFVGMVWPGRTVFPDFSLPETRAWWEGQIAQHLARGVDGIWNDMNDPSTGMSDVDDMLFARGEIAHAHLHNLYGTFMAEATRNGFREHDETARPFVLTRSGSTGIQQFAAVWTGDNVSSWAHLRMSIPETLNLALSGVSFNGADIGGFMDDTNGELLIRWYQAAVLFPFFRNHSETTTAHQEPWCFGTGARKIIRHTINTRYRLLGVLYTEFARHMVTGEPMVRPMCYFDAAPAYRDISDQYALGDSIVVAPIIEEGANKRFVNLPPGRWFDLSRHTWHAGGVIFARECAIDDVPIFVRAGTIIAEPMPVARSFCGWDCDLTKVDWRLHIVLEDSSDEAHGAQLIDDGCVFAEEIPAFASCRYQNTSLTGSFPSERVIEVTLNGIAQAPDEIRSASCTWLHKSAHTGKSVLQPATTPAHSPDQCRIFIRSDDDS